MHQSGYQVACETRPNLGCCPGSERPGTLGVPSGLQPDRINRARNARCQVAHGVTLARFPRVAPRHGKWHTVLHLACLPNGQTARQGRMPPGGGFATCFHVPAPASMC